MSALNIDDTHKIMPSCLRAEIERLDDECRSSVAVSIDGVSHEAEWALSAPVILACGDQVLCMRDDKGQLYIIAPIGRPDTWKMQAPTIDIEATALSLKADRLELSARRLFEKTVDAYRWTSNLLQWCCGRQRTLIDGQQQVRAGRIDMHAKGDVRVDGEKIHLG